MGKQTATTLESAAVAEFKPRTERARVSDTTELVFNGRILKPGDVCELAISSATVEAEFNQRLQERRLETIRNVKIQALTEILVGGRVLARGDVLETDPDLATLHQTCGTAIVLGQSDEFTLDQLPPNPRAPKVNHAATAPRIRCRVLRRGLFASRYNITDEPGTEALFAEDWAACGTAFRTLVPVEPDWSRAFSKTGQMHLYEWMTNTTLMGQMPVYGEPKAATIERFDTPSLIDWNDLRRERKAS